jgi:hypothetical protein
VEAAERETSITWSDADGRVATVRTAQRPMVTRLQRIRGAERVDDARREPLQLEIDKCGDPDAVDSVQVAR